MSKQKRTGTTTDAIVNYLTQIGWCVWRNNTVGIWDPTKGVYRKNKKQKKGIADICGLDWNGRSVSIEIKIDGDRCSADQTIYAAEVIARGGFYCIAKCIDDVIGTLQYYGYNINDNGYVVSFAVRTIAGPTYELEDGQQNIPNANLLRKLTVMEKAMISVVAADKMRKQTIKIILGKYAERVL